MQVAGIINTNGDEVSAWTCVACLLSMLHPADQQAWHSRTLLSVAQTRALADCLQL